MRRWALLLAVLLGIASAAPAQRFGFARQMLPPDADGTNAIALRDVDGDGDLDMLVGNSGQSRLHLNDGAGVFRVSCGSWADGGPG